MRGVLPRRGGATLDGRTPEAGAGRTHRELFVPSLPRIIEDAKASERGEKAPVSGPVEKHRISHTFDAVLSGKPKNFKHLLGSFQYGNEGDVRVTSAFGARQRKTLPSVFLTSP